MNEIAFVITLYDYGVGPTDGVEPVVDGVSLIDRFGRADGHATYAARIDVERTLRHWAPTEDQRQIRLGLHLRRSRLHLRGGADDRRRGHRGLDRPIGQPLLGSARDRSLSL